MAASYAPQRHQDEAIQLIDVLFRRDANQLPHSIPAMNPALKAETPSAALRLDGGSDESRAENYALRLIQNRADIDIGGPEFNFVRSIRVFDVRYAWQNQTERGEPCNRSIKVYLGTYGFQGDFFWDRSSPSALPETHVGLELWGEHCPRIYHRSVFVDWQDYLGNYGSEQIDY